VNPRDTETFDEEARKAGIQPVQAQVVENDQISVRLVYMGMRFLVGRPGREPAPSLGDVSGLGIHQSPAPSAGWALPELARVGCDPGPRGARPAPGPDGRKDGPAPGVRRSATLGQLLEQTYTVEEVDLQSALVDPGIPHPGLGRPDPGGVDSLALYHLDRFLMGGGRLALFADRYSVEHRHPARPCPWTLNLDDFLGPLRLPLRRGGWWATACAAR
jgi:hypothetical protein